LESFGSCAAAGRDSHPVDPFWVFLAGDLFAAKVPADEVGLSWISLDSLVRIQIFQWVTQLEAGIIFSAPFPWR
jgi:hypothetical protein